MIFFWIELAECRHLLLFKYMQKIEFKKIEYSWRYHVPTLSDKTATLLPLPLPHQSIIFQIFFHNCLIVSKKKVHSRLIETFENLLFLACVFTLVSKLPLSLQTLRDMLFQIHFKNNVNSILFLGNNLAISSELQFEIRVEIQNLTSIFWISTSKNLGIYDDTHLQY